VLSEIHDFFQICYAQHRNFMCQLNLLNELTVYLFSQIVLIIQTWYQKKKKRLGWFPRDRTLYGSIFCLGGESRMNSSPKMKSHPSMPAWTSTWKNIRRATPPPTLLPKRIPCTYYNTNDTFYTCRRDVIAKEFRVRKNFFRFQSFKFLSYKLINIVNINHLNLC
jgi:hypothetical protein